MNKSQLFKQAHQLTKQTIKQGDNYNVTFGLCLKAIKAKQASQQVVSNNIVILLAIALVMIVKKTYNKVKNILTIENIAGAFIVLPLVFMFAYLLIAIIAYSPIH